MNIDKKTIQYSKNNGNSNIKIDIKNEKPNPIPAPRGVILVWELLSFGMSVNPKYTALFIINFIKNTIG